MSSQSNLTGYVYLIRLDTLLSNKVRYYIGFTPRTPLERLETHRKGQGAKILAECNRRGITYHIVRVWEDVTRNFERKLKNRKNHKRLCPILNPQLSDCLYEHYKL